MHQSNKWLRYLGWKKPPHQKKTKLTKQTQNQQNVQTNRKTSHTPKNERGYLKLWDKRVLLELHVCGMNSPSITPAEKRRKEPGNVENISLSGSAPRAAPWSEGSEPTGWRQLNRISAKNADLKFTRTNITLESYIKSDKCQRCAILFDITTVWSYDLDHLYQLETPALWWNYRNY